MVIRSVKYFTRTNLESTVEHLVHLLQQLKTWNPYLLGLKQMSNEAAKTQLDTSISILNDIETRDHSLRGNKAFAVSGDEKCGTSLQLKVYLNRNGIKFPELKPFFHNGG